MSDPGANEARSGLVLDRIVHYQTSMLSMSDIAGNITVFFFQDTSNNVRRYDISGQGNRSTIIVQSQIASNTPTPGTRLATSALSGYCENIMVDVYLQWENSSDLYSDSFPPTCEENFYGQWELTNWGSEVVPLVKTYGGKPPKKAKNVSAQAVYLPIIILFWVAVLLWIMKSGLSTPAEG